MAIDEIKGILKKIRQNIHKADSHQGHFNTVHYK